MNPDTSAGVIDFHTHGPAWHSTSWLTGAAFTPEDFRRFMDTAGISAAVVLSHDGMFDPSTTANRRLGEFVNVCPDRTVGFGTVNPRRADAADEMARCFTEFGLRGLKLHPWLQGISMHEPSLDPVGAVLARYGGVMLCHDGTPPYATATQIAAFARRHPGVPVVLGHAGLHDTWREAIAAVLETPNLHICLCGIPPYAGRRVVAECPTSRVLFGSDAGLSREVGQDYAVARVREFDGWGLTESQRRAILWDNPRRLLGWPR
ncbi:MAG TPA: amidohydrolase family protein [Pseudonocardiaceae bacterium]|nr:amidohydrolase family protein [Pseudonocardiaceae bacterium]